MSKKRTGILISSGKLSEEDRAWDIAFWQSVSVEDRFRAACELLQSAYKVKHGEPLPLTIDKTSIIAGSYTDD